MNSLQDLVADEFKASIGAVSSPTALRRFLHRSPAVKAVRFDLAHGSISEETIRRFVDALIAEFTRGVQFSHELALASIAVAIEGRKTKFTEDYLIDLARLAKIAEMDMAPRVAALCLREWHKTSKVVRRSFSSRDRLQECWSAKPTRIKANGGPESVKIVKGC